MKFKLVEELNGLIIKTECTDAYYGQVNMIKKAILDNKLVGYLEYSIYDNKPNIQMIEVADGYKHKGIATKLLKDLQNDFKGIPINTGMTTKDGTGLIGKISTTVENPKWTKLNSRLNTINNRLSEIDAYWEDFYNKLEKMDYATYEMQTESDKIDEEQHQLEDEKRDIEDKLIYMDRYLTYIKD